MNSFILHFSTSISDPNHSISLAEQPFVAFVEIPIWAAERAAVTFDERRKVGFSSFDETEKGQSAQSSGDAFGQRREREPRLLIHHHLAVGLLIWFVCKVNRNLLVLGIGWVQMLSLGWRLFWWWWWSIDRFLGNFWRICCFSPFVCICSYLKHSFGG